MNSSYYVNQQPITSKTQLLTIANWDGPKNFARGFSNTSSLLRKVCVQQKGEKATALFDNNFINYTLGYILCVNASTILSDTFKGMTESNYNPLSILGSLVFTVVKMPEDFIGNEAILSSKYSYGEKLLVAFSYELNTFVSQTPDGVTFTPSYVTAISQASNRQTIIARDMNIRGRAVKGASTGGGGIGVWS